MNGNGRLTQKQDRFARFLFEGLSQREAFLQAGYSPNQAPATLDRRAHELAHTGKIAARYSELQQRADDASVAGVLERKQVLTEIVRGRFAFFMTKLTKDKLQSAALSEMRITETVTGKTTTVKLHDPVKAIAELNKMGGDYAPEKREITGKDGADLIPPTIEYHFPDGTITRPHRNGHREINEVLVIDNSGATEED